MAAMQIDIITLFPAMFEGFLGESMIRIAREEKQAVDIAVHNLRDYTLDKHKKVDDRPFGGGPGMVLCPDPVFRAVEAIRALPGRDASELILLSPQGERFSQPVADLLAEGPGFILLCGHYEGFDERIRIGLKPREISIGDYVLTGGEIPAMAVVDAVVRLIPGVLGDDESIQDESFRHGDTLEYPHYTRPREYRGMEVPEVLISGDHAKIDSWRQEQAILRTEARRAPKND
jgi:tRNA (guanine37-N1)-methyltransferase